MRCAGTSVIPIPCSPQWLLMVALAITIFSALATAEFPAFSPASADDYDAGLFGTKPTQNLSSTTRFNTTHLLRRKWDAERCDRPGHYYFIDPHGFEVKHNGPEIIDQDGRTIWFGEGFNNSYGFRPQLFHGEWHITWWSGSELHGHGQGRYYMMDHNYNLIKNFTAVGTTLGDVHEFEVTSNNTALITVYKLREANLTAFGVHGQGYIYDGIFQEVDLDTGRLLFEWSAADHIDLLENTHGRANDQGGAGQRPWDIFHMNSVEKDARGNYLVSVRHMSTIYYLSGTDGKILWRFGGKNNDFKDLALWYSTNFWGQHHARWSHDMTAITLFDNGLRGDKAGSRAMKVALDTDAMTARLLVEIYHPQYRYAATRGSVQQLEDGTFMVGYGSAPAFSEFSADGKELLCDWQFGALHAGHNGAYSDNGVASYRAYRMPWKGYPQQNPDVVFDAWQNLMFVSWNGATEVRRWVLEGVEKAHDGEGHWGWSKEWDGIATFWKSGFESNVSVEVAKYSDFRLAALDAEGRSLGLWTYSPDGKGQKLTPAPPVHHSRPWNPLALLFTMSLLILLLVRFSRATTSSLYFPSSSSLPQWAKRWGPSSSGYSSLAGRDDDDRGRSEENMTLVEREGRGDGEGDAGFLGHGLKSPSRSSSVETKRVPLQRTLSNGQVV